MLLWFGDGGWVVARGDAGWRCGRSGLVLARGGREVEWFEGVAVV